MDEIAPLFDEHLSALLDGVPLAVYVLQLEDAPRAESLRFIFANRRTEDVLGFAPAAVVGGLIGDVFPNSLIEGGTADIYRDVIVEQVVRDLGIVVYGDEGSLDEQRFVVSAFPTSSNTVAVLFDNLNVTPGRTSELAAIVESAADAIFSENLDGVILTWNGAAEHIFGFPAAEAIGLSAAVLQPDGRADEFVETLVRACAGERIDEPETQRKRKDGVLIDVSVTVSPIRDVSGAVVGAATIARDTTAARSARAELMELAAIVSASQDAMCSRSLDGLVRVWNAGAERLFGYSAAEMIGQSMAILVREPDTSPDAELPAAVIEIRDHMNSGGKQEPFEMRAWRKDGSEVQVYVTSSSIRDESGELVGVTFVCRDVTTERKLEGQLRQVQKMEAIGSLASGVAHDFNNTLTVIRGAAEGLLSCSDDDELRDLAGQIDLAAQHASRLTRQLLAFGRQQVLQAVPTDINLVVEATLGMVARLLTAQIRIERNLGDDLSLIQIDRGQLEQVILNLSVNAGEAMPDGGVLAVRTTNVELDETYTDDHLDVAPGPYVLLSISDSGSGMDAETLLRAFDPFYTTKSAGTGLGLATVYGIVKQSDGHVDVYSELGMGTTFKIFLPASVETTSPVPRSVAVPLAHTAGGEVVLLVEDLEMLRPLTARMLEKGGYVVLSAGDGAEALRIAEEYAGRIDLLFTDVVMPGISGRELSEQLVRTRPDVRILFTSGYPADTIVRHGIADQQMNFIHKPYNGSELLAVVRSVLASADHVRA